MNSLPIGELAALATSACFTAGSIFFTLASRRVGSLVLNRTRLVFAWIFLALGHWIITGSPFPLLAGWHEWFWLGTSGIVGLALGDIFLFEGYRQIGPRLTMLTMSLSPIIATLLAWIFFTEVLGPLQLVGIGVTISGIAWVVLEKNHKNGDPLEKAALLRGTAAGIGAAACQAVGLILARQGLGSEFSALSGNFIRMTSAVIVTWTVALLSRQASVTIQTLQKNPKAIWFALSGAFIAPFLGVSLSLVAIQSTKVGIASTLMALPPVFLLPIGYIFFKERFGISAVMGTLVALAGIVILFII